MLKRDLHGLSLFISDIRNSKGKDAEIRRINKELANIRSKFNSEKLLSGYHKKKYVCKLIFIYLLGYNFDFGHAEAVNLLNSVKFSEKNVGYLFVSVVMNEKSNFKLLVHRAIESDLGSSSPDHQNLALKYIANLANKEMAEDFGEIILKLIFDSDAPPFVKQSAVLCLLSLYRIKSEVIHDGEYNDCILSLINDSQLGVVTAGISLIDALAADKKVDATECASLAITKLHRIVKSATVDLQDYSYYYVPAPWLLVKLLKLLQYFSLPTETSLQCRLIESIEVIFNRSQEPPKTKKIEHRNCKHAIMFEAISLIHHIQLDSCLQIRACNILEMSFKQAEANVRFLALEAMRLLSESDVCRNRMKEQLGPVLESLKTETDICMHRKSSDLLYSLCDESNVNDIIEEMTHSLEIEDADLRKEIVLKIAILAEKYCSDRTCYVNTVLNLLKRAGDYVSEAVWYRFVQVVVKAEHLHDYVAKTSFLTLTTPPYHERLTALVGYVLGEYGNLIAGDPLCSPEVQLCLLHSQFPLCSSSVRSLLLTTYMKFANLFPSVKDKVKNIFKFQAHSCNAEIQQRALEYLNLCERGTTDFLATVLDEIPPFKAKPNPVEEELTNIKTGTIASTSESKLRKQKRTSITRSFSNLADDSATSRLATPAKSVTLPQFMTMPSSEISTLNDVFTKNLFLKEESNLRQSSTIVTVTCNQDAMPFLIWNGRGILHENNVIQVQVEDTFLKHRGILQLKYKNKTSQAFFNLNSYFCPDNVSGKLKAHVKPCPSIVQPNEEIFQNIEVECLKPFSNSPCLILSFNSTDSQQTVPLGLPLTLNKFIEPSEMDSEIFFSRWRCMAQRIPEEAKTFPAKFPIDKGLTIKKLTGFGMKVLDNVDQVRGNLVCSGIFHAEGTQVGILLRLQCNREVRMFRLTVRSLNPVVSQEVLKLVQTLL